MEDEGEHKIHFILINHISQNLWNCRRMTKEVLVIHQVEFKITLLSTSDMETSQDLLKEISENQLEGQFILFLLRGLLTHLRRVEEKIFVFADVLTYNDYFKISRLLRNLKEYIRYILRTAVIYKPSRAILGVHGTHV